MHGEFLQCEDDGAGMPDTIWAAFIGMGDPSKEGDASTIGENGTGHTANWMAFDRVDLWTAWAEDPHCFHLSYSYDEAWQFSQANGQGGIQPTSMLKSHSGARVKGTGTVIRLTSPYKDESAIRVLPGDVLRNIARILSPWHLDMVTVNGEKPKSDFPKGEFYRAVNEVVGVGQVEIIAGFADEQVRDQDRSWGTWGAHVCSHSELLDQLTKRLSEAIAPELLFPNVWFMVRVHAWKRFEGKHTRRFFKPSLFGEKSFQEVVRHLHAVLVPEIRKRTRLSGEDAGVTDEVIDRVVSRLIQRVGEPVQKNIPPPIKPRQALAFKPARIRLVCGTSYTLAILNANAEDSYRLDATRSGGSILVEEKWLTGAKAQALLKGPTQVTYRAGGEFGHRFRMSLTQQVTGEEDVAAMAMCEIRLDEELSLAISPKELVLEPGETGRVSIANDEGKGGLTWSTTPKGRISPDPDLRSAQVTAPMEPGNYTITCSASDGSRAEGRLSVRTAQPRTGEGPGTMTLKRVVIVEGVTFTIMSLPTREETLQRTRLSMGSPSGESKYSIWFNFSAPEAQAAMKERTSQLDLLVNHEVVTRIAAVLCDREAKALPRDQQRPVSTADVLNRRDTLMAKLHG
jgi:hypothetical protein